MTIILPRVFFGTMYSDESEFEESRQMIHSQKDLLEIKHVVIEGLEEREAHNILWQSWNSFKNDFDLFVKVDADTILGDEYSISRVWSLFRENPRVTGVQVRLKDYYTDDLISGLNFFSPAVVFKTSPSLYCDRVDTNHDIVLKGEIVEHLEPIGLHCKDPTLRQSFHYGLHRMLKNQKDVIRKVLVAKREPAREYALLGAACAIKHRANFLDAKNSSYQSQVFRSHYKRTLDLSKDQRESLISCLERI